MTLFRAPVVSEFQKSRVVNVQKRWQAFRILTWVVSFGAGLIFVLDSDFKGDKNGDHIFRGVQHGLRSVRDAFVTGDASRISFTPPPLPSKAAAATSAAPLTAPAQQTSKEQLR